MSSRKIDQTLVVALVVGGVVAACGGSDAADNDGTFDSGAAASSGTPGASSSGGASGRPGASSSSSSSGAPGTSSSSSSSGGSSGSGDAGDLDADVGPGPVDADAPDQPPVSFPLEAPSLFGYRLIDAFPGVSLFGAMDVAWPAGSNQPFVLQRGGSIIRLTGSTDIEYSIVFEDEVYADAEAGALGLALHPKFADAADPHPYAYVWYNAVGSKQRLARFTYHPAQHKFDGELVLVEQVEQTPFHNAGHVRFGPDGFLYFGNGDDQPQVESTTTQRLDGGLFSGIFRIDVDSDPAKSHAPPAAPASVGLTRQGYLIPNDNPFVGRASTREEYFALGFRNPYSFNFDQLTGRLYLGDVGDTFREEVDQVVAGGNYGWPFFEGKKQNSAPSIQVGTLQAPLYDYTHASVADLSAIMGGYVYRGAALPEIDGKYLFSDWPTARVWALDLATGVRTSLVENHNPEQNPYDVAEPTPVGVAQDNAGEFYLTTWPSILRLERDAGFPNLPRKLSDTHIFRNLATLKTSSSLTPYSIRSPLWSDGAAKQRWIAVPPGQSAKMNANGQVTMPVGTIVVKEFDLPATSNPVGRSRRLETRLLVVGSTDTYGLSYRWNADGSDADLVLDAIDEPIVDQNDPNEDRLWHFPSFAECWSCHRTESLATKREQRVLGFRGEQLNFDDQLAHLAAAGVLDPASIGSAPAAMPAPSDATAPIAARAGAYLAANCSPCHHAGASYFGGGDTWLATWNTPDANRGLLNQSVNNFPMATELGYGYTLVKPGDPQHSVLLGRIKATVPEHRMPPLGRTQVDPVAVDVITQWITQLP